MSTERAHSLCSASFLPALLRPAPAACRGPSSGRTEARLSTHSVFGRPSKGLVCQEASAPCSRAAASLTAGVTRAEEPLQVTGAAGRAGQQPPQLPLGANRHLPAGLAWLRCYPHPRRLGDHFGCRPANTPFWRFGAGTERGQLAGTRSTAAPPGRSCPLPRPAAPEKQRPALRCRECWDSDVPRVEYQGYSLKRKLTSNVCN